MSSSSSLESNSSSSITSTDTAEAANGSSSIIIKEKPKIMPLPNGPYYLLNDMKPKIVENLQNSKGEPLSTVTGVALLGVEHQITNHFAMVHMQQLVFQVKIKALKKMEVVKRRIR
jgi:hypothetical protein